MANEFENIIFGLKDEVAVITVNRPEKLNALNAATISDLMDAFFVVRDTPEIRAAVLTGAGNKAFVAGADITEIQEHGPLSGKKMATRGQMVLNLIEELGKATVAAINGWALGGGLEIAMACSMRVAATGAQMGQPESKLGVIPGYGGTQRLPRLIGRGAALEMILTGEPVDAQEAHRLGLVNHVLAPEELLGYAIELARKTTRVAPLAVRHGLEAVNRGLEAPLSDALRLEADLFGLLCGSDDKQEGTTAFLEKREPKFKGC